MKSYRFCVSEIDKKYKGNIKKLFLALTFQNFQESLRDEGRALSMDMDMENRMRQTQPSKDQASLFKKTSARVVFQRYFSQKRMQKGGVEIHPIARAVRVEGEKLGYFDE